MRRRRACKRHERLAPQGAPTIELTLIRHGATDWNSNGRFQGHSDVPLCERGRDQARAIAERLSTERIDRIYSSDLSRALETAQIVAAPHGLTVTQDARLREFAFGQWEGLTWDEILASHPQLRSVSVTGAQRYAPEGGETFEDVTQRVGSFFEDVRTRDRGHVVIVSHAGPLHAALAVLGAGDDAGDGSAHAVSFSPASLTRIAMDERGARLIILGDVRHLHPTG